MVLFYYNHLSANAFSVKKDRYNVFLHSFSMKQYYEISRATISVRFIRNFKGFHFCQFHINYFFHFVHSVEFFTLKAFLFFSVARQKIVRRCNGMKADVFGFVLGLLFRCLNALEKILFPPPLLLKVNKYQNFFFLYSIPPKNKLL